MTIAVCPSCDATLAPGDRFCSACGMVVALHSPTRPDQQSPAAATTAMPAQTAEPTAIIPRSIDEPDDSVGEYPVALAPQRRRVNPWILISVFGALAAIFAVMLIINRGDSTTTKTVDPGDGTPVKTTVEVTTPITAAPTNPNTTVVVTPPPTPPSTTLPTTTSSSPVTVPATLPPTVPATTPKTTPKTSPRTVPAPPPSAAPVAPAPVDPAPVGPPDTEPQAPAPTQPPPPPPPVVVLPPPGGAVSGPIEPGNDFSFRLNACTNGGYLVHVTSTSTAGGTPGGLHGQEASLADAAPAAVSGMDYRYVENRFSGCASLRPFVPNDSCSYTPFDVADALAAGPLPSDGSFGGGCTDRIYSLVVGPFPSKQAACDARRIIRESGFRFPGNDGPSVRLATTTPIENGYPGQGGGYGVKCG